MGIVRDVTVDQLTQAVGNIDTSTLAQDSTLQDVVTAINNISGGSDPVTNTTVNTLGKDTTLQSIVSAISGLGATLGSDKANISGDNIADKATFRSNIGASKVEYIEQIFPSDNMTMTLNYPTGKTKDNMLVLGIAFYRNAAWIYVESSFDLYLKTSQIAITLRTGSEYLKGCSCRIIYV